MCSWVFVQYHIFYEFVKNHYLKFISFDNGSNIKIIGKILVAQMLGIIQRKCFVISFEINALFNPKGKTLSLYHLFEQ